MCHSDPLSLCSPTLPPKTGSWRFFQDNEQGLPSKERQKLPSQLICYLLCCLTMLSSEWWFLEDYKLQGYLLKKNGNSRVFISLRRILRWLYGGMFEEKAVNSLHCSTWFKRFFLKLSFLFLVVLLLPVWIRFPMPEISWNHFCWLPAWRRNNW